VSASAIADVVLFELSQPVLGKLLRDNPDWWPHFVGIMYENMGTALALLADQLALSSAARLARRLVSHAEAGGAGPEVEEVPLSQAELAAMLGMSRASLARALAQMADLGLVERGYGRVRIVDAEGLRRIAASDAA
jgi:CRP-like cAMP-binding protein